ncbi:hypothetical protein GGI25_004474 [Coemansia spiralis]|uniref:mRNA export factor GLE1 n=2 Tax=Coemansia TaxID=4863 RepID=A0A9W8KXC7_9FUNG|nr:GLE1-like protein-domain-containing protein [Coemansia spiralis]KAJ1988531.1 hypothetical protein EDC05_005250 [Coemansia umbellata]KAJ2619842.1 hypothetical protein GGI26_005516 [Coemansia sp. RSA 1358]KAJ2673989.1 hypothetical protein GGI25_004474 [Coemansia spiralis]
MRYGLFFYDSESDHEEIVELHSHPVEKQQEQQPGRTRGKTVAFEDHSKAIVSPLFRQQLLVSRRRRRRASENTWMYARQSLGTPFPMSAATRMLPIVPPQQQKAACSKGDRYRELATKARLVLRKVSTEKINSARAIATQTYARPIQRELEETQRFLANLTVSQPQQSAKPCTMDLGVEETLKRVNDMRKDFEQKRKDEAEAKLRKQKELEEQKRKEMQTKEDAIKQQHIKQAQEDEMRKKKQTEEVKEEETAREKQQTTAALLTAAKSTSTGQSSLSLPLSSPSPPSLSPSSSSSLEWASRYRSMYRQLMDTLAPTIKSNKAVKAYCFKQRGIIVRSFGQLKDSQEFVNRVADTVKKVVADAASQTSNGSDVQRWMLNLVAKAIVKQAEKEVSVAHHAAYPLAAAAVLIMQSYPLLADMILVRLIKKCPYVIPEFASRKQGQPADEYLRSIGYKEKDEGELETEGIYVERMAGMIALFAAIVQTSNASGIRNAQKHPLSIKFGWIWMARMLNQKPRSVSPLLVHTFLSIAGTSMMATYGRQFKKLVDVVATEWIAAINTEQGGPVAVAAKSNLKGFLEEYRKTDVLKECEGRVIKRF